MQTVIVTISLVLVAACGERAIPAGADAEPAPRATWYQDVAPILATHCMACHQEGGIAPFPLTTYDDTYIVANQVVDAVEAGIMPPFSAEDGDDCAPTHGWKEDPRLSADERATLALWIEDGRARGEPATIEVPAPPTLGGITHSLTANPYVTSGYDDQFVCFLLDPETTVETWLSGWSVRPGNPAVVHHAVLSSLPADLMPLARNAIGVGNDFPCSAGAGAPGTSVIGAWAPGGQPFDGGDAAIALEAGGGLVLQIHYHPGGGVAEPDATTVDLRLTTTPPAAAFAVRSWGNAGAAPQLQPGPYDPTEGPAFTIPPGVGDAVETMRFTVPDGEPELAVLSAFPHMHYVGVGLSMWVNRASPAPGEPARECLVNVDRWNFDWQRQYLVDAPLAELPRVRPGDEIELRCRYDNRISNPFVQRALDEQGLSAPVTVELGESTIDEMCIGLLSVIEVP
ncbi:MAG: hypothetical protein R2939_05830 [Kofleriaceae bacterium]